MTFNFLDQGYIPEDSYSRQLDRRVAKDEYPYGYSIEIGSTYEDTPIHAQHLEVEKPSIAIKRKT